MLEALHVFLAWWQAQLLDLLPGQVARRLSRADDGMLLAVRPGTPGIGSDTVMAVTERRQGQLASAGEMRLDPDDAEPVRLAAARHRLPVVLQLPAAMLLERSVSLPLAAERDLGRVLFHEMDRLTPFAAQEVYWSHAVQARDRAHARLQLRLSLVPKAPLEPLIAGVRAAGLPVAALELEAQSGEVRRIGLDDTAEGAGDGRRKLVLAGCGVMLLLAIATPFIMQARASAMVEQDIAAAAPDAARAAALRRGAGAQTSGRAVVAAEHRRAGDALEAIALLTTALPDNTYLTAVTFDAGKLTMDGQSKSAPSLIAPLTANGRLLGVSFTAPVVRNTQGADSFSLQMQVTP